MFWNARLTLEIIIFLPEYGEISINNAINFENMLIFVIVIDLLTIF